MLAETVGPGKSGIPEGCRENDELDNQEIWGYVFAVTLPLFAWIIAINLLSKGRSRQAVCVGLVSLLGCGLWLALIRSA